MRFVVRRLMLFVIALLGISILIFAAVRILPGDIASVMAGMNAPPERVQSLREQLGLDRSLVQQYADWFSGVIRGDFGTSMLTGRSTSSQIGSRASITMPLIILGLCVAMALGLPLGFMTVAAKSPRVRGALRLVGLIGGSIPALWGGLILILLFARGIGLIGILPSQGFPTQGWGSLPAAFMALILPAVSVGVIVAASLMRYVGAAVGSVASSGFIDMAMGCGMTRQQALLRVGCRLAVPQLVSVLGLTFAEMITGVMVIENLFALPGLGSGLVTDMGNRDLIAVQSELFMLASVFLIIGMAVDIAHRVLDPRLDGTDDMSTARNEENSAHANPDEQEVSQ